MRQKHDKSAIIKEGIRIFREKGYHNTGVDDILRTCKIPSGSFYNFFKNKEGFALQALDYYNQEFINYLEPILSDTQLSPLERLRKVYEGSIEGHLATGCQIGCLLNGLTSEVAAINPAIEAKAVEDYQNNNKIIAATIREGQEIGEIRNDFSAEDLADYLINGFMGAATRMKAGKSDRPLRLFMQTTFEFIKA